MSLPLYILVPGAALLSDIALLVFLFGKPDSRPFRRPLIGFYSAIAVWNAGALGLALSQDDSQARLVLYLLHNFHSFLPCVFLWLCLTLSGRKAATWNAAVLAPALAASAVLLTILNYSYWGTPDDLLFVSKLQRFTWGYYPVGAGPGAQLFSLQSAYCILTGLALLFFPVSPAVAALPFAQIRGLLVLLWVFAFTSYLPVHGIDIMPLGNAADAIVSAAIVGLLYRVDRHSRSQTLTFRAAGVLAAIAVAVLCAYLIGIVADGPAQAIAIAVVTPVAGLGTYLRFFTLPNKDASVSDDRAPLEPIHNVWRLTPTEMRICEHLQAGHSRDRLPPLLGISEGTLKNHLKSIYGKTIDRGRDDPSNHRDKLQRLTALLHSGSQPPLEPAQPHVERAFPKAQLRLLRRVDPREETSTS